MKRQNDTRLTDSDRRLLTGMETGKRYGFNNHIGNDKPFHSIPGFPQGVHGDRIDRLVKLGYLKGVDLHYIPDCGNYFDGYVKVKDIDDSIPEVIADRIKYGLPQAVIRHHWTRGDVLMVVLMDGQMIHFVTVTGNLDGKLDGLTFDVKSEWIKVPFSA